MRKTIFFIIAVSFQLFTFGNSTINEIKKNGYVEYHNKEIGKLFYDKIYAQFDQFIQFAQNHPQWVQKLYQADENFCCHIDNERYGSPPMGYIDERKSNKCKKVYFHYTKEYECYLKNTLPSLFEESLIFSELMDSLSKIHDNSFRIYEYFIREIEPDISLSKSLYTEDGKLSLLIKIVRYEESKVAASNPHYDFSALSLLLDNTDKGKEALLLAPYKENVSFSDFSQPHRKYQRQVSGTSALLIVGLALKELGCLLGPTPHAVLRQTSQRYAMISFAMAPSVHLVYDQIKLRHLKIIP